MARHGRPGIWFAAALLALPAQARAEPLDTIKQVIERLQQCWEPPPRSQAKPVDITVIVSFNRQGAILGQPRISYETEEASDNIASHTGSPPWKRCNAARHCHFPKDWAAPSLAGRSRSDSGRARLHPNQQRDEHG